MKWYTPLKILKDKFTGVVGNYELVAHYLPRSAFVTNR